MNKSIRLLIEGFFDDEIFNVKDDIKTDILNIGELYYNYQIGDFYYQNKKPYAVCCGESKYFNDNNLRFCLLKDSDKYLYWRTENKLVKELDCFNQFRHFKLKSFNDFKHIDEDGYKNTQIIKNNYDISEFPAFEYCINQGNNVYLPAIDELLVMYLNEDKLGKYSLSNDDYRSSTLYSAFGAYIIDTLHYVNYYFKFYLYFLVRPFFHLD